MAITITSSVIAWSNPQIDGRFSVRETHTDNSGKTYDLDYYADASVDQNSHLAQAAIKLAAFLNLSVTAVEIYQNIVNVTNLGSLAVPTFVNSTVAANVAALRTVYALATQQQAIMIGDYLNTLTNAQLMSAFGLTSGQATTLRTNKLAPAATQAAAIRAAAGQ